MTKFPEWCNKSNDINKNMSFFLMKINQRHYFYEKLCKCSNYCSKK